MDLLATQAPTARCGVALAMRDRLPKLFDIGSWFLVLGDFDALLGPIFAVVVRELEHDNVIKHPVLICSIFWPISNHRGNMGHVRTATLPSTLCDLFLVILCTLIFA
jgi:hypothetical protein